MADTSEPIPPAVQEKSSGKNIGRMILYPILAVLLGIGIYEWTQKNAMTSTRDRWMDEFEESNDLTLSDLSEPDGSPTVTEEDANGFTTKIHTWKGVFREYSVFVDVLKSGPADEGEPQIESIR